MPTPLLQPELGRCVGLPEASTSAGKVTGAYSVFASLCDDGNSEYDKVLRFENTVMQSPIQVRWNNDRGELTVVWDAYVALLALEAQVAAVKTAIAEKRLTRKMLDVFSRNFSEEEITELMVLLNREVVDNE